MEITKEVKNDIAKWIEVLRSGQFTKAKGSLQTKNGYCCLGVGCKVFIPKSKQRLAPEGDRLFGDFPLSQDKSPKWLIEINSAFENVTGVSLSSLNDDGIAGNHTRSKVAPLNFDEIADLLQAVYIEGILDGNN